jgi:hypothetical protein
VIVDRGSSDEKVEVKKIPPPLCGSSLEQMLALSLTGKLSPVGRQLLHQIRSAKLKAGGLSGALIDPRKVYRFRMINTGSIVSSAGGNLSGVFSGDPSSTIDWSSITSIFNVGRLKELKVSMVYTRTTGQTAATALYVGSDYTGVPATPSVVSDVASCSDSKVWATLMYTPKAWSHTYKTIEHGFVDLAGTLQPGPYAGFSGGIVFIANAGSSDNSTEYGRFLLEYDIEVRGRTS